MKKLNFSLIACACEGLALYAAGMIAGDAINRLDRGIEGKRLAIPFKRNKKRRRRRRKTT